jgi:hypothetical protein
MGTSQLFDVASTSGMWVAMWFCFWPGGRRPVASGWHPWP